MAYYNRYQKSYKRPEVPTGPVSMTLVQESEDRPPLPEGTILNSPAPSGVTWFVEMTRKVPGPFWSGLGVKATFWGRDFLEDCDMFSAPVGWRLTGSQEELAKRLSAHNVTFVTMQQRRENADRAKEAKIEKDRLAAEAADAKRQEGATFQTKLKELTTGLYRVDIGHEFVTRTPNTPEVLSFRDGSNYQFLQSGTSTITGQPAFAFPHGGYDDDRFSYFVDAETREAAYKAQMIQYNHTSVNGIEWLSKYKGCVGTDYYEWLASQPPSASVATA